MGFIIIPKKIKRCKMSLTKVTKTKKMFATLCTFWIPIKKIRKKYRAILLIGIINWYRIRKYENTHTFNHSLAVGAIMKDEGAYLKEWLDYHILVGVEKFYLYDNGSTDNTMKVVKPYVDKGIVDLVNFPGKGKQLAAYVDIINRYSYDSRWIAFIDLDEFLVPVNGGKITDVLFLLPRNFAELVVSWVIYGSGGHKRKPKGLVIENYKYHAKKSWGIKSIVNPRMVATITNPHCNLVAGYIVNENGKKLGYIDQTNNPPSVNKIRCNHYITKSYDEYIARRSRGKVDDGVPEEGIVEKFKISDRNDVYDPIMDVFIDKLKQQ